jgi:hypothetical protein
MKDLYLKILEFMYRILSKYPIHGFVLLLIINACVKENPVPAYIHIPAFTVNTKNTEGSAAHKITDAWVYVDNQINGVFQMPVTLPVIELGKHEIQIFPGIRNNGTRSNPIVYPLLNAYKISLDLKAEKVDTIRPTTTYSTLAQFKLLENFENNTTFTVNRDGNSSIGFTLNANGFEGKCGQIVLNKTNPLMEKASNQKVSLADNAESIFLEMHYKTEAPLSVGIIGFDNANVLGSVFYKITLFPSKEWNKTYINLGGEVKELRSKDFQVVFKSLLPDSLNTATILLDNIKLIQK